MEAQTLERHIKFDLKEDKGPVALALPLPLSLPTSPSHEFSFTISLHPPPPNSPSSHDKHCTTNNTSFVVDLAPADDIFFGGHLLPLHLLSRPTIPPRASADISITKNPAIHPKTYHFVHSQDDHQHSNNIVNKERIKNKTLTSFFSLPKLRKSSESSEEEKKKLWKKWKAFNMTRLLKKYTHMVETIFFFKAEKEKRDLRRRPYSFSGRSKGRERDGWKGKKVQFSAPASMRTSPTNSGLLLASPAKFSSSEGSSMEELQSAIQAAIAHCKNSVAFKEDKCK